MPGTESESFKLLRAVPLLAFLPDEEIRRLQPKLLERFYPKGTFVFREGQKAEWFYFLKSGAIKCLKFGGDGEELILKILLPGEIFCCESVTFDGTAVHPGNAQALIPCVLLELSRDSYFQTLQTCPQATIQVVSYLGKRLSESQDLAKSIALDPAEKRIAALLLRLAEKVGKSDQAGIRIELPLRREDIAHMVGIREETAVRMLTRLKEQGVLLPNSGKELVITDIEALRKLAS